MTELKDKYEVIIMGSGSTGSSIAFHLAKKGYQNVLVLDSRCVGCGQTSRSSAVIRLHYTNPAVRDMAIFSWRFWRNFQEETGCEYPVFTKTGIAYVGPEDYVEAMEEIVRDLRSKNVEAYFYDPEEFRQEVFKYFNTEGLAGVTWEPNSGYGDPNTSVRCYIEYARNHGIDIAEYTAIKKIVREDNVIIGVETDKGFIKGEIFVNSLGVWTNDILASAGKKLPIEYVREDVVYMKNPSRKDVVPPGWGDLALGFYARPDGETQTLVGTLEAEPVEKYDEPGEYTRAPLDIVKKRMDTYLKRFPDMIEASPTTVIYGYYDVTPDWQPIIGFDDEIENLIHMVGLSGHGFKLSPAYGDIISDIIIHGGSKRFKVEEFSIERFKRGESKHSKYKYGIIG